MNKEIEEILAYLETRKDYVIWAGFAQFAHLGTKCSPDIDIYTNNSKSVKEISAHFQRNSWKRLPKKKRYSQWILEKLEKNGTTFDIVYSKRASKLLFLGSVRMKVYGHNVRFISKECLFLTKLGQSTWEGRSEEKRGRDFQTINLLRKSVNLEKISKLTRRLPVSFWKTGKL